MFNRTTAALILAASLSLLLPSGRASADAIQGQFVLVVELEIDSSQLEPFKAAIKENGETAVRVEPGCRGFSAVLEKDNPTRMRLFEIYENADAFKAHLETLHFKKYAETTKDMVKSRKRIDNVPDYAQCEGEVTSQCADGSVLSHRHAPGARGMSTPPIAPQPFTLPPHS